MGNVLHAQAHGKRGDEAQQGDWHGEDEQDADQGAIERADRDVCERIHGRGEQRTRDQRGKSSPQGGDGGRRVEEPRAGVRISDPATQPVGKAGTS